MKKVFLFCAVAMAFAACGKKAATTEEEATPAVEEAAVVEEVVEAPCTDSTAVNKPC